MKFKKIMAGVLAATLAVTSLSIGTWADSGSAAVEVDYTTAGGNYKITKAELNKYTDITVTFTGIQVGTDTAAGQCGHGINTVAYGEAGFDDSKHGKDEIYCSWGGWAIIGDAANTDNIEESVAPYRVKKDGWWQPSAAKKFEGVNAKTGEASCTLTVEAILSSITSDSDWKDSFTLNGIFLVPWQAGAISSIKGTPKSTGGETGEDEANKVTYTDNNGNITITKSELDKYTDITVNFTGIQVGTDTAAGQCGHGINTVAYGEAGFDDSKHGKDEIYCSWGGWAIIGDAANTDNIEESVAPYRVKKDGWWQPSAAKKFEGVNAKTGEASCTLTVEAILNSITSDSDWKDSFTLNGIILAPWQAGTISSITGTPKSTEDDQDPVTPPEGETLTMSRNSWNDKGTDMYNYMGRIKVKTGLTAAQVKDLGNIDVTISVVDVDDSQGVTLADLTFVPLSAGANGGWEADYSKAVTGSKDFAMTLEKSWFASDKVVGAMSGDIDLEVLVQTMGSATEIPSGNTFDVTYTIEIEEEGGAGETGTEILSAPVTSIESWEFQGEDVFNAAFANLKAGDQIIFSFEKLDPSGVDPILQVATKEGDNWNWVQFIEAVPPVDGKYTHTVTADEAAAINSNAMICLKGDNAKVTSIIIMSNSTGDSGDSESPEDKPIDDSDMNYTPPRTETEAPAPATSPDDVSINKDAIPEGAKLEVTATEVKAEEVKDIVATVKAAAAKISEKVKDVVFNTKVEANLIKDGVKVQPNGKLRITVNYDGKSNIAVYVDGDKVEFLALTISADKKTASFETTHLSTFYLATIDAEAVAEITSAATPENPDKNQATGVVIAIIPAVITAAGVIISKKRK